MSVTEVQTENLVESRLIVIEATPEQVFAALTGFLTLADARVGSKVGLTPEWAFKVRSSGAHLTEFEPNQIVAFAGEFWGHPLQVTVVVQSTGGRCSVTWRHSLPASVDANARYAALDYSEAFLYNLRSRVETGADACLPTRAPTNGRVELQVTIDAEPEDAFRALTDPDILDKWIGGKSEVELHEGGNYDYGWRTDEGERVGPILILSLQQGQELTHSWNHGEPVDTQVTWTVEGAGGTTTLKLTHSGFAGDEELPNYALGWASFLCTVKALLEGKPQVTKA